MFGRGGSSVEVQISSLEGEKAKIHVELAATGRLMYRECLRCRLTLPIEDFPHASAKGHLQLCSDCWSANPVVQYVAYLAADALVRLRAIDALLYLGYVHAARLIARGATDWPSLLQLREGIPMPRQPLWWISFDADTIALLRMLLRTPDPSRTPVTVCAA